MFKVMMLVRRKPGLTHEEFRRRLTLLLSRLIIFQEEPQS